MERRCWFVIDEVFRVLVDRRLDCRVGHCNGWLAGHYDGGCPHRQFLHHQFNNRAVTISSARAQAHTHSPVQIVLRAQIHASRLTAPVTAFSFQRRFYHSIVRSKSTRRVGVGARERDRRCVWKHLICLVTALRKVAQKNSLTCACHGVCVLQDAN